MANRRRKCKGCGKFGMSEDMYILGLSAFCGDSCRKIFTDKAVYRAREKAAAKAKRDTASKKSASRKALIDLNRRDLRWQHRQTQKAFNRMRVLQELLWFNERGQEPSCISCGKPLGGDQWCCGHFKTVGSQGGLRYDPLNTHLQHNRSCNMALSGDICGTKRTHGYIQGLKNRFGESKAKRIIDHCETNASSVKWEWEKLEEMRAGFNREIRRIEKLLA